MWNETWHNSIAVKISRLKQLLQCLYFDGFWTWHLRRREQSLYQLGHAILYIVKSRPVFIKLGLYVWSNYHFKLIERQRLILNFTLEILNVKDSVLHNHWRIVENWIFKNLDLILQGNFLNDWFPRLFLCWCTKFKYFDLNKSIEINNAN